MVTRILPEWEWPRIAETGASVDQSWRDKATCGCVVVVESARRIIAIAFAFLADDDVPHVDGLWIAPEWRGRLGVLRQMHRGLKYAIDRIGGSKVIPIESAVWMTRPERRAHGVQL